MERKTDEVIGFVASRRDACEHRRAGPSPEREDAMVDLVLTEADAGRTVEVAPGTAVQLRLPENPTTGYRWVLTLAPADCARIAEDSYLAPSGEAVGAGGLRVVGIAAVTASPCALDLAYRRPWEQEVPAARELTFTLVAAP